MPPFGRSLINHRTNPACRSGCRREPVAPASCVDKVVRWKGEDRVAWPRFDPYASSSAGALMDHQSVNIAFDMAIGAYLGPVPVSLARMFCVSFFPKLPSLARSTGAVLRWTCFGATADEKLLGRRRTARPRGAWSTTAAEATATRTATATTADEEEEEEEEEEAVHKQMTTMSRHRRSERKRRTRGIFGVVTLAVAVAVAIVAVATVTAARPP